MCNYEYANYTIRVSDELGTAVNEISSTYNNDSPENVEVVIDSNLEENQVYTATIIITTVVNSTTVEFEFGKLIVTDSSCTILYISMCIIKYKAGAKND